MDIRWRITSVTYRTISLRSHILFYGLYQAVLLFNKVNNKPFRYLLCWLQWAVSTFRTHASLRYMNGSCGLRSYFLCPWYPCFEPLFCFASLFSSLCRNRIFFLSYPKWANFRIASNWLCTSFPTSVACCLGWLAKSTSDSVSAACWILTSASVSALSAWQSSLL